MNEYTITCNELKELINSQPQEVKLVDVRDLQKHLNFNIGGQHIPLEEMPDRLSELDSSKLIVTYCTSGNRSMRALEYLVSCGFTNVKSLEGGMTAWQMMGV